MPNMKTANPPLTIAIFRFMLSRDLSTLEILFTFSLCSSFVANLSGNESILLLIFSNQFVTAFSSFSKFVAIFFRMLSCTATVVSTSSTLWKNSSIFLAVACRISICSVFISSLILFSRFKRSA